MQAERLRAVPRCRDLTDECAAMVIARFGDALPDLRRAVVLVPHHLQFRRLRGCILERARERGHAAVLPPTISTFRLLFRERALYERPVLPEYERKLLLATELDKHPDLFSHTGRWELTDRLLQLFDDIHAQARNRATELPGDPDVGTSDPVQTLYRAWRADREKTPDFPTLYRDSLDNDTLTRPDEHVFLCGFNDLAHCESAWAARLYQRGRLTLITHAGDGGRYAAPALDTGATITGAIPALPPTDNALSCFLGAAFSGDGAITARARDVAGRFATSPAAARISVFKPEAIEQHAFGIYLKIRDWLDAGISPVAVVSQDRKLSRRLRAVVERYGVSLCDHAGWALSTTASAAAVSVLLPPVERGFDRGTILALARSPYCRHDLGVTRVQKAGAQLERASEQLEPFANLDESIAALLSLPDNKLGRDAKRIVRRVRDSLAPLRAAMRQLPRAPFDALFKAMDVLGMSRALRDDEAGQHLLEELKAMAEATRAQGAGNWNLWRRWILHVLEHENFTPKERNHLVELYNLRQSLLARPGGLVVAALDVGHTLPADPIPLLDENQRRALGLKAGNWRAAVRFDCFRSAIESADHVLLTCQGSDNDQVLTPSPWLEGLQHFHALAYGDDLEDRQLGLRARAAIRSSAPAQGALRPPARPDMPAPRLPEWPARLSVRDVQNAVECPYRFFAKKALGLAPEPEADDYDSRRDYGVRLHRCLGALHAKDERLPGPMDKPWTREHRDRARALARAIVEAEFSPRIDRHYSAAERMNEALETAYWYVDVLIRKFETGAIGGDAHFEIETGKEKALGDGIELHGRADCVIHANDGVHIFDYKSGSAPSDKDMASGKDVQLTAYALFHENVKAVSYVSGKQQSMNTLEGEQLDEARARLVERLETFKRDADELPLPAWADDAGCRYCDYDGVCRRGAWRVGATTKRTRR